MKNDYKSTAFKTLLDKLQQESWQLELIISGFAIYGLITGYDTVEVEYLLSQKNDEGLGAFILSNALNSMSILVFILLTHVVIRGIWIGAIGLRYVSGDIEYDNLNYTDKFKSFLLKKVGSFDRYISKLENICSTLFALAFLMIFFFISSFMLVGFFAMVVSYIKGADFIPEAGQSAILWIFGVLYALCIFMLLIDFFGAGLLKKYRWTSKLYFPIYRIFGFLTLSFLYRPLLYNFLDQKRARWLGILIVPIYLLASLFASGYGKSRSNYLVVGQNTSSFYTNKENYDDQLTEKNEMARFVSIPSKVIDKSYLPVFIGFNDWMEDAVFEHDTTLLPKKDERGYGFNLKKFTAAQETISITIDSEDDIELQKQYLKSFGEIFKLYVDSSLQKSDYGITVNQESRFGFETYIDLDGMSRGKHLLQFVGPFKEKGEFVTDTLITIPFWYYKD